MPDALNSLKSAIEALAKRVRKLETLPRGGGGGGGGQDRHVIMDEGIALPDRPYLDFVGPGVTATDDLALNKTIVTIPGGGGGTDRHIIQDEGVSLPDQPRLNFIGAGVTATNNPITLTTDVTIPGGGAGSMNLQQVILLDMSAAISLHYTPDPAGIALALAAAQIGDIIWLPAGSFITNIVMLEGIEVRGMGVDKTIIFGQVTGAERATLSGLTVVRNETTAGTLYGVLAPATGEYDVDPNVRTCFQVIDVAIKVVNGGTGNAYGFSTEAGGELYLEQVRVEAVSADGEGWAGIYHASFWMEQGMAKGSTGRFVKSYY
jgi:hypothetical protein